MSAASNLLMRGTAAARSVVSANTARVKARQLVAMRAGPTPSRVEARVGVGIRNGNEFAAAERGPGDAAIGGEADAGHAGGEPGIEFVRLFVVEEHGGAFAADGPAGRFLNGGQQLLQFGG